MDQRVQSQQEHNRQHRVNYDLGRIYVFDRSSGIYKPDYYARVEDSRKNQQDSEPPRLDRWKLRRKWVTLVISNIIALFTALIVAAYTYYAAEQVAASESAINVAMQASRSSERSLTLTLQKLQGQVEATKGLSKEAARQTRQSVRLAIQAEKQSVLSATQLEISEKPLVNTVPKIASDFTVDPNGAHLNVSFSSFNGGFTPATEVTIYARLFREFFDNKIRIKEEAYVCSQTNTLRTTMYSHLFSQEITVRSL